MNKQNKDYFISFRVTAEEKKWIEEHSYGNYRLISDFVRDCVFEKTSLLSTVSMNSLHNFVVSATTSTSSRELSTPDMQPRST